MKNHIIDSSELDPHYWSRSDIWKRCKISAEWLLKSFSATNNKGSSHIYSRFRYPFSGWHKGYPETTGYIIETLFNAQPVLPDLPLVEVGNTAAYWLVDQQLPGGLFPALLVGSKKPSLFNSGMIIFGLIRANDQSHDQVFDNSLDKLRLNLLSLDPVKTVNTQPTYYFRALWGFKILADYVQCTQLNYWIQVQIEELTKRWNKDTGFNQWGFDLNDKAFSHTVAYTLRGLLELAILYQDTSLLHMSQNSWNTFINKYTIHNKIAGYYDRNWNGDYSFVCITGNFQMALIGFRMYEITGHPLSLEVALKISEQTFPYQITQSIDKQLIGAVPGSSPIWGPYMRFKNPNWAVKFALDTQLKYYHWLGSVDN